MIWSLTAVSSAVQSTDVHLKLLVLHVLLQLIHDYKRQSMFLHLSTCFTGNESVSALYSLLACSMQSLL